MTANINTNFNTDTPEQLAKVADYIHQHIPLAAHFGFQLAGRAGASLWLTAPLAPNRNDKGTLFAGSIATLCTLAGWALATRMAADLGINANVLAQSNELHFSAPITTDAIVVARVAKAGQQEFCRRLLQGRRSRLTVAVNVYSSTVVPKYDITSLANGQTDQQNNQNLACASFSGSYVVGAAS